MNMIKLPDFKSVVNTNRINDLSKAELEAVDRCFDGIATEEDYDLLEKREVNNG